MKQQPERVWFPQADDFIVDDSGGQIQVCTVGSGADSQIKEVDVTLNRADGVIAVSSNDSNQLRISMELFKAPQVALITS